MSESAYVNSRYNQPFQSSFLRIFFLICDRWFFFLLCWLRRNHVLLCVPSFFRFLIQWCTTVYSFLLYNLENFRIDSHIQSNQHEVIFSGSTLILIQCFFLSSTVKAHVSKPNNKIHRMQLFASFFQSFFILLMFLFVNSRLFCVKALFAIRRLTFIEHLLSLICVLNFIIIYSVVPNRVEQPKGLWYRFNISLKALSNCFVSLAIFVTMTMSSENPIQRITFQLVFMH